MQGWKVLIVDDEDDMHVVTQLAFRRKQWQRKPFDVVAARSAAEAMRILEAPNCPAFQVAIIDVVMESETAGLDLCKYIRATCPPSLRIVLRTGQPGAAPEEMVLNEYDIDHYMAKPEATADKLYAIVRSCLRSSQDISTLLAFGKQLRSFTRALQSVSSLDDLLIFMDEGLKFLELKYSAQLGFIYDLDADLPEENANAPVHARSSVTQRQMRDVLLQAHEREFTLFETYSGADFGLSELAFIVPFVATPEENNELNVPERVRGGLLVEFSRDYFSPKTVSDMRADVLMFLENWVIAFCTLRLHERVAREKMLRERMYVERVESIANMVAGVAHEINTPLGVASTANSMILTLAKQLVEPTVSTEDRDQLLEDLSSVCSLLTKNIARAHNLIKSFKQLSASQLCDDRVAVNLRSVIEDCLETIQPEFRKHSLTVKITSDPALDLMWQGYPGHFSQVIINLLQNVMRYAYVDGVGGTVDITIDESTRSNDEQIFVVRVRDYGKGIEESLVPRIFHPFVTTGRDRGGTGLGLSICENIMINLLRGRIACDSAVGIGTTFLLEFPRAVPQLEENQQPIRPSRIPSRLSAIPSGH